MVLLVACLASAALALSDDSGFPYFGVSLGGHYASYSIKTESSTHWYHDKDRDEMVYDEDLTYDIFSFEGGGPMLDVQAGFSPGERFVFLLDFGLFVSIGGSNYKLYSRDKDEYAETEVMVRPLFGFGFKVFPFPSKNSALYGLFAGATLSFMWSDNQWEKYGMDYCNFDVGGKFEIGKLWSVSEHNLVGFTLTTGIHYTAAGPNNEEGGDENFRIGENPKRDPVDELNNLHLGISLTAARK
ncbi:MAG: hypothetical protein IKN70_05710 [Fibrobacter sp.]|nr:hypothetical protein [Fibrobacter sp.]